MPRKGINLDFTFTKRKRACLSGLLCYNDKVFYEYNVDSAVRQSPKR